MADATTDDTAESRATGGAASLGSAPASPVTPTGGDAEATNITAHARVDGASTSQDAADTTAPDDAEPAAEGDTANGGDADAASSPSAQRIPVQYGVGPFSLREVILGAVWVVAFGLSFVSTLDFTFNSIWAQGITWILPIGVPTVAVFLIALRRLSPTGIRRVGSLGIDQFASVAFSVSAIVWLGQIWSQVQIAVSGGHWVLSWMPWAQLVLMLAGVVLTVCAPIIPGIAEDFRHRPTALAHRSARPIRPVSVRPRAARAPRRAGPAVTAPVAAEPAESADGVADLFAPQDGFEPVDAFPPTAAFASAGDRGATSPSDDTVQLAVSSDGDASVVQAFWALVPEERDVVDEHGVPLFRIGPTAWALAIEDRGDALVIRHEDGRVGFLRDVSGVTRG